MTKIGLRLMTKKVFKIYRYFSCFDLYILVILVRGAMTKIKVFWKRKIAVFCKDKIPAYVIFLFYYQLGFQKLMLYIFKCSKHAYTKVCYLNV